MTYPRPVRALEGMVALVTGASSGIGAATARRLAADGASVALVARRHERLEEIAAAIRADGGEVTTRQADVTDRAQAEAVVDDVATDLGRLDVVVNNAGVMLLGPVAESPLDEWERMVALNVLGSLYVTRSAVPHLVGAAGTSPRGTADIVFVSSTAGRVARAGGAVYGLTKFGIGAFAESLRQELVPARVRVGVVEPGTVRTELTTHLRAGVREAAERQIDAIEALRPDDVADAIAYMVGRDRRVAVNELLVRAAEQTW